MQKDTQRSSLSAEEVRHLGRLARIHLSDDEVETFGRQLTEVIDYNVTLLSEVNVEGVTPTSQTTGLTNVWRDDQPEPSMPQDLALSNAPDLDSGQFNVPKVLGQEP